MPDLTAVYGTFFRLISSFGHFHLFLHVWNLISSLNFHKLSVSLLDTVIANFKDPQQKTKNKLSTHYPYILIHNLKENHSYTNKSRPIEPKKLLRVYKAHKCFKHFPEIVKLHLMNYASVSLTNKKIGTDFTNWMYFII